jgi:hypothetical protein
MEKHPGSTLDLADALLSRGRRGEDDGFKIELKML